MLAAADNSSGKEREERCCDRGERARTASQQVVRPAPEAATTTGRLGLSPKPEKDVGGFQSGRMILVASILLVLIR